MDLTEVLNLENAMKVVERIWQQIDIDDMQFGLKTEWWYADLAVSLRRDAELHILI